MAKKSFEAKVSQLEAEIEKAEDDYQSELEEFVDQATFVIAARNEVNAAKMRLEAFKAASVIPDGKDKGKKAEEEVDLVDNA